MSGSRKYLILLTALALMIAVTVIVDKFFVKGVINIPPSPAINAEKSESGREVYTYKFHPFNEFPDAKPDFTDEGEWIFSHPIGIGNYSKIVSVEIPDSEDYLEAQYQTVFDFSDGYNKSIFWEKMEYAEGWFTFKTKRICPFMQLRLKTLNRIRKAPSWVTVKVESDAPIGLLGISGIDAYKMMMEEKGARVQEPYNLDRHFSERPVRIVRIDDTFDTYRSINILNGLNCNVIGEISFENLDLSEAMESVRYYGDIVKIWKLTGTARMTRDSTETVALSIYKNSPSSIILWEDEGLLSKAVSRFAYKEWSPVKLDRGTLWTGVILFSLLFLIIGTVRIFKLGIKIEIIKIAKYLKFMPVLAAVFLLPLTVEGLNISISLYSLKIVVFGSVNVFLIEFVRCFFLMAVESILNFDMKKNKKRKLSTKHHFIIFLSALLTSFLFAGFPGFSFAGSILLVISNFIAGLILGYLFLKEYSLTLNAIIHFTSVLPFIILIGK
jgi:hypothetical protein